MAKTNNKKGDVIVDEPIDDESLIKSELSNYEFFITPKLVYQVLFFEATYKVANGKPILIIGPTGSGKSLFTHIFKKLFEKEHADRPVITYNCSFFGGDINMIRSELFGHVKGAFTGAKEGKEGIFAQKDVGAVILEEIGDLPPETQAQLLRFIETGEYQRVGSAKIEKATVSQVIGVTNREDKLRDDLRYRFQPFYVPPLHERREDILYYIVLKYPDLARDLEGWELLTLLAHNWPGNIRELLMVLGIFKQLKNIDFLIRKDQYKRFAPSFLFELERRYTDLHGRRLLDLIDNLKENGVQIEFLENYLNVYSLGIIPSLTKKTVTNDIKRPLNDFKFSSLTLACDDSYFYFAEKYGFLTILFYDVPFNRIIKGFERYCWLFYQNMRGDKNLIDIEDDIYFYRSNELGAKESYERYGPDNMNELLPLRKQIITFLSGIEVAEEAGIEPLSIEHLRHLAHRHPENSFLSSIIKKIKQGSDRHKEKIFDMREDELLRYYYNNLLNIAGGKVAKVARMSGIKLTTLRSKLDRLSIKYKK